MKLAVVGSALAGGAIQVVDILLSDYSTHAIRIYDDAPEAQDTDVLGVRVYGPLERILYDYRDGVIDSAVIAIGSIAPRTRVYHQLAEDNIPLSNIISSSAIISHSSSMGSGNVILPLVYIGPRVAIGNNNYITTSTIVNHDTNIGSHCYFSTCVSVAGRVNIGDGVRLDTSAAVTADAVLPDNSLVGPREAFGPVRGR